MKHSIQESGVTNPSSRPNVPFIVLSCATQMKAPKHGDPKIYAAPAPAPGSIDRERLVRVS
jgi:hypothetical protein